MGRYVQNAKVYAKWLKDGRGQGLHLASGYAACRIPKLVGIRCCPVCLKAQVEEYGEPYWKRIHQVVGTNVCVTHGCELSFVPHTKTGQYRHTFRPAMSRHKFTREHANVSDIDHLITSACEQLLSTTDVSSPTYAHGQIITGNWREA